MAHWFKDRFAGSGGSYAGLIDTKNLDGLTSREPWSKTAYFKEYQKSFQQGEYNLKISTSTPGGQVVRSYFSGGVTFGPAIHIAMDENSFNGNPNLRINRGIRIRAEGAPGDVTLSGIVIPGDKPRAAPVSRP